MVGTEEEPPGPGLCTWFFDHDVTIDGPVTGLQVFIDGAWRDPISVTQIGQANVINCTYDTAETLDGKAYQIESTPTGILQAARIVFGAGTVEAP